MAQFVSATFGNVYNNLNTMGWTKLASSNQDVTDGGWRAGITGAGYAAYFHNNTPADANQAVAFSIYTETIGSSAGMKMSAILRGSAAPDNWYEVGFVGPNWTISKVENGVVTVKATAPGPWGAGLPDFAHMPIVATIDGTNTIRLFVNGSTTSAVSWQDTSSPFTAAGKVGAVWTNQKLAMDSPFSAYDGYSPVISAGSLTTLAYSTRYTTSITISGVVVAVGDVGVMSLYYSGPTWYVPPSFTDSGGNVWTKKVDGTTGLTTNGDPVKTAVFVSARITTAGTVSLTVATESGLGNILDSIAIVQMYSGFPVGAGLVDVAAFKTSATTDPFTTADADEVLVYTGVGYSADMSLPAGWTEAHDSTRLSQYYRFVSQVQSAATVTGTNVSSSVIVSLKIAAPPLNPSIGTHPTAQTANEPGTATFTVSATASSGGGSLSYQWQRANPGSGTYANVSTGTGGTSASYTTAATDPAADHGASYRCVVTDSNGSTTSNAATLTVRATTTTVRPGSDITTTGWTASTGTDFYALLDEASADDADYITSPTITASPAPIKVGLKYPMQTGTWARRVRAKCSTGTATLQIRMLNDSDTEVGSVDVAVTSSWATYDVSITLTGPATRCTMAFVT